MKDYEEIDYAEANQLLGHVRDYPVSSQELKVIAEDQGLSQDLIGFFQRMPADTRFDSREDLMRRGFEAEFLAEERSAQPEERVQDEP